MIKHLRIVFLIAFILLVLSIPKGVTNSLRNFAVSSVAPTWDLFSKPSPKKQSPLEILEIENQMLRKKMERLQHWIVQDDHLQEELQNLLALKKKANDPFLERRGKYLSQILGKQLHALPANVVFREPVNWSSTLWIGVGESDNRAIGEAIVAKNSPVVVGKTVVGLVETVLENRSSVRLITDRSLTPSVRVVRGRVQDTLLANQLRCLIKNLACRDDVESAQEIALLLSSFCDTLPSDRRDLYLAKGQLQGASQPHFRMLGQTLKGTGFNYDFSDEEGPAQNLRTTNEPLISLGDILVTTGMDGVFPPDLHVAVVTKLFPLREGECSYSLEAEALAPNLNTLSEVFVLSPQ